MNTLIIPCAGGECISGMPLILNRHPKDGTILAAKLLSGIFPEHYDRIIYAVTPKMEERFSVSQAIAESVPGAEVIVLAEETSGAAETVYRTICAAGISGGIAVKDSHSRIVLPSPLDGNAIAGLDLMQTDCTVGNLRNKSFIILNEQNIIRDIAEKRLRSDVISAGMYSFRNAEDFARAFIRLSDPDYPAGRLYVSHVISYLIGCRDLAFSCTKAETFEDWTDLAAWKNLRRGILPASVKLVMADLDGTLFDTAGVNCAAYSKALEPLGYSLDYGYFRRHCYGRHFTDFLPEIMPGISRETMNAVHSRKKSLYKKYLHLAKPNAGLLALLGMCRSECRLALVTTASSENTYDILHAFGLENFFDLVLAHEDIARSKPDPEGYIKAMQYFGAEPEECIIFEDSATGIEAARRSGAQYFTTNITEEVDTMREKMYNFTSHHITSHHITSIIHDNLQERAA